MGLLVLSAALDMLPALAKAILFAYQDNVHQMANCYTTNKEHVLMLIKTTLNYCRVMLLQVLDKVSLLVYV